MFQIKIYFLFLLFFLFPINFNGNDIYHNYIQLYGEGPIGGRFVGFETKISTKEEAVEFARNEIIEFVSGMIFGYNFIYKVENPITGSKGYFDLTSISKIRKDDKNLSVTQLEESQISIRIQGLYRLTEDQKTYLRGYQSSVAKMSSGESTGNWVADWDKRLEVYKDALRNAVLNGARKSIKSRPQYIKGKLFLAECPTISLVSGEWKARVKVHLVIKDVSYFDNY